MLNDVNPRAIRALLGIWSTKPAGGQRLSKPDCVFRCDDELEDLKRVQETLSFTVAPSSAGGTCWRCSATTDRVRRSR
jgi:hypothetical protein